MAKDNSEVNKEKAIKLLNRVFWMTLFGYAILPFLAVGLYNPSFYIAVVINGSAGAFWGGIYYGFIIGGYIIFLMIRTTKDYLDFMIGTGGETTFGSAFLGQFINALMALGMSVVNFWVINHLLLLKFQDQFMYTTVYVISAFLLFLGWFVVLLEIRNEEIGRNIEARDYKYKDWMYYNK